MQNIRCPNCERELLLPEDAIRRRCQCPRCNALFTPQAIAGSEHHLSLEKTNSSVGVEITELHEHAGAVVELAERFPDHSVEEGHKKRCIEGMSWGLGLGCMAGLGSIRDSTDDVGTIVGLMLIFVLFSPLNGFLVVAFSYAKPTPRTWIESVLICVATVWCFGAIYASHTQGATLAESIAFADVTATAVVLLIGTMLRRLASRYE